MAEWASQIGRIDIRYALTSLNRFSAAPRQGHLTILIKIFGYLQTVLAEAKNIVVSAEDIGEIKVKGLDTKVWLEYDPDATEEIDKGLPEPWGKPISTTVYLDSDHAHYQVKRRSVSGVCWSSSQRGSHSYMLHASFTWCSLDRCYCTLWGQPGDDHF